MRKWSKPLSENNHVALVYVDNKSLTEQGRWPWSRKKFAELRDKLQKLGASVVAFDMSFPDLEKNIDEEVARELEKNPGTTQQTLAELKQAEGYFDYNILFANSLKEGASVLGFIFLNQDKSRGELPPPALVLAPQQANELEILNMKGYIGNLPLLQKAAQHAGFINGFPDSDGVYRFSPLLLRLEDQVYFSLSLQAVSLFSPSPDIILQSYDYQGIKVLEAIQLGQLQIPVTPMGEILIPYRNQATPFPLLSATDILEDRVPPGTLTNKIVFIGFSAIGLGDLVATPINPLLPGVEIHATIAAGILEGYLPYKPVWGKGVTVFLVLLLGFFAALLFPRLSLLGASITAALLIAALFFGNRWLWLSQGIMLVFAFPTLIIAVLYIISVFSRYLFGKQHYRMIRRIFDQYVPPEHVDVLCKKEFGFGLQGENKELTVLFSDIRDFTTISESLSAPELKDLLDRFFTPMTEIIFAHHGTVDKYIGDAVMAFWGAPLEDSKAAFHAVSAAFAMQSKLTEVNSGLTASQKPNIRMGIGINTGVMHVGDMGSRLRLAYTVLGDAVNLASRLEGLTKIYQVGIIVGENTQKQTQDAFLYRKLDRVHVKGKKILVDIYQPLCPIGEASEQILDELELHTQALEFYLQANYEEAKRLFQKLMELYPNDRPLYEGYLQRMQAPLPVQTEPKDNQ
jgi:adenylate cyclase